jgi:hypothetical protein
MAGRLTYRDWLCEESIDGFEATHPDFDLVRGDHRVVRAETLGELAEAVDDWITEHERAS